VTPGTFTIAVSPVCTAPAGFYCPAGFSGDLTEGLPCPVGSSCAGGMSPAVASPPPSPSSTPSPSESPAPACVDPTPADACPVGTELSAGQCLPSCRPGFVGVGGSCVEVCRSVYVDGGSVCTRDASEARAWYARGSVPASPCRPSEELVGLLCYDRCRPGYSGSIDWCRESDCRDGYTDFGLTCTGCHNGWGLWGLWGCNTYSKDSYYRGPGNIGGNYCPGDNRNHGKAGCLEPCREGYQGGIIVDRASLCVESRACPEGYTRSADLRTCSVHDSYVKATEPRGPGVDKVCKPGYPAMAGAQGVCCRG
jgi:hypothetical protein